MDIYEIRVKGDLGEEWSEWLDGIEIVAQQDGTSLLVGPVVDQSALHGLLLKLHDLGLTLISVARIEDDDVESC